MAKRDSVSERKAAKRRNERARRIAAERPAEVAAAIRSNFSPLTETAVKVNRKALKPTVSTVEKAKADYDGAPESERYRYHFNVVGDPPQAIRASPLILLATFTVRPPSPEVSAAMIALADRILAGDGLTLLTVAVEKYLPDTGDRPIVPSFATGATFREGDPLPDVDPGPLPGDQLPMFEDGSAPAGYGALVAYDAAGGETWKRGRGVPIPPRLFVEALLFAQAESVVITPTLREVAAALWPNGWERKRHLPLLASALAEVTNHEIPWRNGLWRPVVPRWRPFWNASLDEPVPFDVRLPAGAGPGARVHRPTLRQLGVFRAAEWRLYLSLCAYWDRRGYRDGGWNVRLVPEVQRDRDGLMLGADGKPLRKRNGAPVTRWSDPRAVRTGKRIEPERRPATLSAEDLRRMVFPPRRNLPAGTLRWQRKAAGDALRELEQRGTVETVRDAGGVRVYRRDGEPVTSQR